MIDRAWPGKPQENGVPMTPTSDIDSGQRFAHRGTTSRPIRCRVVAGLAAAGLAAVAAAGAAQGPATPASSTVVMPQYDGDRNLLLPHDYRQWVLVGTSLGLSYAEGAQGHEIFNATLMEPTAYRHFVETGEFREGTMLALILQGVGTDAAPARRGRFAADVHGVEMAVKDSARVPETWAYYGFGGPMSGGYRTAAAPQPKARCHDCHAEHAARDKVFTQFYGLLREAAPAGEATAPR
jgi:hypothetical protein